MKSWSNQSNGLHPWHSVWIFAALSWYLTVFTASSISCTCLKAASKDLVTNYKNTKFKLFNPTSTFQWTSVFSWSKSAHYQIITKCTINILSCWFSSNYRNTFSLHFLTLFLVLCSAVYIYFSVCSFTSLFNFASLASIPFRHCLRSFNFSNGRLLWNSSCTFLAVSVSYMTGTGANVSFWTFQAPWAYLSQ